MSILNAMRGREDRERAERERDPMQCTLHSVAIELPPLTRTCRERIDEWEYGEPEQRAALAAQRQAAMARCVTNDERADVRDEHEHEDKHARERVAWQCSATGRLLDALHGNARSVDPRYEHGQEIGPRCRWYCPACQDRWCRGHFADDYAGADVEMPLVIEHRFGRATSDIMLRCMAGCSPEAIALAARAIIVEREAVWTREHLDEAQSALVAELAPTRTPAFTWCVPDLVPCGSLSIINGVSGSAKTWLAEALAIAIASGRPVLGRQPAQGRVLLVLAESFAINYARVEPIARGLSTSLDELRGALDIWPCDVPFKTHVPTTLAKLAKFARARQYSAIVIDNLSEIRGGTSQNAENDATIMGAALRPLAQLAHDGTINGERVTDKPPAIVLLHHDRGSSAVAQHADFVLRLTRGSQAPEAPIRITLGEGCRVASAAMPLTIRFAGMAPDPIVPELVQRAKEQPADPDPLTDRQRAALASLREHPGQSMNALLKVVGGSKRDIGPCVRGLDARGLAELRDDLWYAVADEE